MRFMKCLIPTDEKKSEEDILLDAVMNVQAGITKPVQYVRILKAVSEQYGVDWIGLSGNRKKIGFTKEKSICMYLLHEIGSLGYDEIAEIMGQRRSISVIHGIDRITTDMRKCEKLRNEVLGIVQKLK